MEQEGDLGGIVLLSKRAGGSTVRASMPPQTEMAAIGGRIALP